MPNDAGEAFDFLKTKLNQARDLSDELAEAVDKFKRLAEEEFSVLEKEQQIFASEKRRLIAISESAHLLVRILKEILNSGKDDTLRARLTTLIEKLEYGAELDENLLISVCLARH